MTDRFFRFSDFFETKFSPTEHTFQNWWLLAQEELEDAYTKAKDDDKAKMKDMIAELWGISKEDVRGDVPEGYEDRFDDLIGRNYSPTDALRMVNEEKAESDKKAEEERKAKEFEDRVPEEWKARFRELIAEGRSPEDAYNTVMKEIEEARTTTREEAERIEREAREKIEELPEEVRVPTERAIAIRIGKFERETAPLLEREKYERMSSALARDIIREIEEGETAYRV